LASSRSRRLAIFFGQAQYARKFDELIDVGDGHYDVTAVCRGGVSLLEEYFGPASEETATFSKAHEDFAYHLQSKTEEIVKSLVRSHVEATGVTNVALAGGVAMNCKLNRELANLDCVDELFVQPAANDSGICLEAALEGHRLVTGEDPDIGLTELYYGPDYSRREIGDALTDCKLSYERVDDICASVAELLADGQVGGWFQGRMEYGARALGNRSILANPRTAESVDRVNETVKHRESWRPFAPSILFEARDEYLVHADEAPFMILLDSVHEHKRDEIPAVTHVDGTTRPQTVRKSVNERYYRLIEEFETLTGTPVVLNTSFNVAGEPIVESPRQALADFYSTGLDFLALGDYLLVKEGK
ncbi:MAG: carbamoyltransferase C-terminal domain-containing protein, partial [Halorhabdus sp.]